MRKVIKHVINVCVIAILSNSVNSQDINDDYLLLKKVIKLTKSHQVSSNYKLLRSVAINNDIIEKYYGYRYLNKPLYKILIGYDEEKDSLIYDEEGNKKKQEQVWSLKYRMLDSLFTRKDIEYFLEQRGMTYWDSNMVNDNIAISDDNSLSFGNIIHKPYYSLNGEHAIVKHTSVRTFYSMYIFRKEDNDWVLVGDIKNLMR